MVGNETLGYYMARTYLFLRMCGLHEDKIRFRQHLPTEMAHYARDCWDAEVGVLLSYRESCQHIIEKQQFGFCFALFSPFVLLVLCLSFRS